MQQQRGFTLIELIIVIVILGILAVTAAPRFIGFQSDAREAALEGVAAALAGGSQLVFARAAINGVQNTNTSNDLDIDNDGTDDLSIINGYPNANAALASVDLDDELLSWVDFSVQLSTDTDPTADFIVTAGTDSFIITQNGTAAGSGCEVVYSNAAAGGSPSIAVTATDC